MERVKNWMERKGIATRDVPKVVLAWELSSKTLLFVGIGLCVRYEPLRAFFRRPGPRRMRGAFIRRFPDAYSWGHSKVMGGAQALATNRFFAPLPRLFGVRSKRFAMALPEALFLYKLFFTFYTPLLLLGWMRFYQTPPDLDEEPDFLDQAMSGHLRRTLSLRKSPAEEGSRRRRRHSRQQTCQNLPVSKSRYAVHVYL